MIHLYVLAVQWQTLRVRVSTGNNSSVCMEIEIQSWLH